MLDLMAKLSMRPVRTVVVLSLVLFLSGTWILPLLDRDEPRFAEASREMLQRPDYIIPWFNGQYRFDKPPLIYWCQMASYRGFGENTFAARLPSALFATGTALLLVYWGRRLGRPKAGFHAALILVTTLQMLIHGRLSVADQPMIFFVAAAVWAGWELSRPENERRKFWWWMFYGSLALGFLAKGPIAWTPLGGLWLGRWRRAGEFRFPWRQCVVGLLLALGLVALWGVPALLATHGEFMKVGLGKHVVSRSVGVMEGHGGKGWLRLAMVPFYFGTFFLSFFPWAIWVPKALRQWWPARRTDALGWYLLVQGVLVFAIFSLVQTKLLHYTLPAFPCLALWLALQWEKVADAERRVYRWACAMTVVALLLTLPGFLAARPIFISRQIFQAVKPHLKPEMRFGAVSYDEPSMVWEFRGVITNYMQELPPSQAADFLKTTGPLVLVVPTPLFKTNLAALATNATLVRIEGLNPTKGRKLTLPEKGAPWWKAIPMEAIDVTAVIRE